MILVNENRHLEYYPMAVFLLHCYQSYYYL